jgi:hypothetical protein
VRQINNAFWFTLLNRTQKERADRIENMAKGRHVGSHEHYVRAVGFTEGLDWVLQEAENILKAEEEDDAEST